MDNNDWFGKNNALAVCPYPKCGHTGTVITKVHCRTAHGMEREEVGRLYGKPKNIRVHQKWGW